MKQYTRKLNNALYDMFVNDEDAMIYRTDEEEHRKLVRAFKKVDLPEGTDKAYQLYLDQVADYVEEQYENSAVNG